MAESKTESRTDVNVLRSNESQTVLDRTNSNSTQISMAAAFSIEPTSATGPTMGRPQEQLQVDDAGVEDATQYPKGAQLWLNMLAILLISFLRGLDTTIVAVTIPSLTDQFKTVADIGWYSAVYGLVASATCFFFGKVYKMFDLKWTVMASVAIFELGSLICTFAPSSKVFILGRALTGMSRSELSNLCKLISHRIRFCWTGGWNFSVRDKVLPQSPEAHGEWYFWIRSVPGLM